ncbi:NUDIX domain-containing protein [Chitinophaga costaii]|uniref:NUDIX domain-containing protein n=1 Tax=Chitinophaga costaii TaxID=1335309 RepID=A0A1C4EDC9_9BACT|nr:NUDIX domain-containing protein [Chitinophaga costaii]PUZ23897.1 NUDIX hydrolase [Chitinophaga costaii]SCC41555.1 NUDIX domain-containing protein [Chitinophaga costaii]
MALFNVRVYGIMINEKREVLVMDEYIRGGYYTKFPGGGLELGEGTLQCVVREWQEELQQEITVVEHLYTTDFFQISAFDQTTQIIAIYYRVAPRSPFVAKVSDKPFDFEIPEDRTEVEGARWIAWEDFSAAVVTLPIDKVVADLVKVKYA